MDQKIASTAFGKTLAGLASVFSLALALPCTGNANASGPQPLAKSMGVETASLQAWAKNRLFDALEKAGPARPENASVAGCKSRPDAVSAIVAILSVTDPKTRQDQTSEVLSRREWTQLVCDFREAEEKMTGSRSAPAAVLPEVEWTAREAAVQLLLQAVQTCARCADASLLQTVAAGSAVKARMYPEALRLLFDLLEVNPEFRPVYESVQRTFAATHRGKGEVSLGAPR